MESTKTNHSPLNLSSTLDKDKLKFNPKEIILSSLPCVASPRNKAVKVSLFDIVEDIDNPAKAKIFEHHRQLEESKRGEAKITKFKAFTFSIDYAGELTGLLVIDIDHIKEKCGKSPQELKEEIQDFIPFLFLAISNSGEGLFGVVRYHKENDLKAVGKAIYEEFDLMFGIKIDKLFDAPRLRIDSYDPKPFKNYNAGIYDGIAVEEPATIQQQDNDSVLDSFSNDPAIAFNNSGLAGLEIINEVFESLGYTITAGIKPTIFEYQRAGGSLKSIVAFYNRDIVKFQVFSPNTGLKKEHYNLYELYKEIKNFDDYTAQKELSVLGFGTFNDAQPIKANLQDINFRNKYRINVSEIIPPPQVALYINDEILGTLGNFSLITGKAKAKKSFLISMAVATALTDKVIHGILKSELPANQNQVLFFDTEQGKYHVQRAVKRICEQIGVAEPSNLHAFHLRSLTPSERLQFIEAEIYSNDCIGVVIIDGIKDLITSINDEGEATMIASKLLKWSEERNIHILTVLHQNKGDNNARGHIGTELINKAETVLSVTVVEKDKEVSIVEAQQTRNREPQPFAFRIDENGIPFIISDYEATPINSKISIVYRMQDLELYEILSEAFKDEKSIKYADLVRKVKEAYIRIKDSPLGDNKAKDLISICKGYNFIKQSAEKQPYTLLPFTEITS